MLINKVILDEKNMSAEHIRKLLTLLEEYNPGDSGYQDYQQQSIDCEKKNVRGYHTNIPIEAHLKYELNQNQIDIHGMRYTKVTNMSMQQLIQQHKKILTPLDIRILKTVWEFYSSPNYHSAGGEPQLLSRISWDEFGDIEWKQFPTYYAFNEPKGVFELLRNIIMAGSHGRVCMSQSLQFALTQVLHKIRMEYILDVDDD